MILAIDTTGEYLSLALAALPSASGGRDGYPFRAVAEETLPAERAQDEILFGTLDKLLRKARSDLRALRALAVACGPGRFTGIRVGMTFGSVLSSELKIPAVAVTTLEACGWENLADFGVMDGGSGLGLLCPVLPAYKDEFYFQIFAVVRGRAARLKAAGPPRWAPLAKMRESLPSGRRVTFCGPGLAAVRPVLEPDTRRFSFLKPTGWPRALSLVGPALGRLKSPRPASFRPLYLKPTRYETANALRNK